MNKLYALLGILAGMVLSVGSVAYGATILFPSGGGTGTSTNPTYGQVLVGNAGGTYTLTATSSLGIASGGTGSISTSSPLTANLLVQSTAWNTIANIATSTLNILFSDMKGTVADGQLASTFLKTALTGLKQTYGATQTGATQTLATSSETNIGITITNGGADSFTFTPTWIGTLADARIASAATWNAKLSSVTADAPLSGSGTPGSHLVLSTAGTWSGNAGTATALASAPTKCSAGNYTLGIDASGNAQGCTAAAVGTVTSVTGTWPVISSGGATPNITWGGLATTTAFTNGNLLVSNGTNGLYAVATSSETCTSPLSCTAHTVLTGGGAITLSTAGTWSGVAGTATALATPRAINGQNFDGTAAITITAASSTLLANSNTFSGTNSFSITPSFASSLSGVLKAASGVISAAANGTDYTLVTAQTCGAGQHISALTAVGGSTCSADAGGTFSYPFTTLTQYATTTAATTTMPWFQEGLYASTTNSVFQGLTIDSGVSADAQTTYGVTNHEWSVGSTIADNCFHIASSTTLGTVDYFKSCKSLDVYLPTLVSNGFVKTSGSNGALSIDTSTYLTGNQSITLSGVVTGSGTTAITTAFGSQTAGVLGNAATGNTAPMATSTLFGNTATFLTTGNVGIGSTSPWGQLSVNSNLIGTAPEFVIGSSTGTNFIVNNAGSVGIGTSTPGTFFSVQGVLNALTTGFITFLGEIVGKDVINGWFGRISPTHSFVLTAATSTATWTATSTPGNDVSPALAMPFAGTLRQMRCPFNTWLGVNVQINGANVAPSYAVASSTVGLVKFTGSNTFNAGDKIAMIVGTTTSAVVGSGIVSGTCTFDSTETP